MSTDTEITRSLHEAAEHAPVPPVDVDVLRAGGRRLARRRRASVAGAAALVLAIVGSGALLGAGVLGSDEPGPVRRDDRPEPTIPQPPRTVADLTQGPAPALPYVVGGVVHAGTAVSDLGRPGLGGLRTGGGVTLGWDADSGVVELGSHGQRLLDPDATGYPAVSPDGGWAAWPVTAEGQDARVVVWSLGSGRAADGFPVPEQPQCCDSGFRVAGVDDDGRVVVAGDRAVYVHDPEAGAARVLPGLEPSDDRVLVNAGGVVVLSGPTGKDGGDARARMGSIDAGWFDWDTEHTGPEVAGSTWWSPYRNGALVSRTPDGGLRTWSIDAGPTEVPERLAVPVDAEVDDVVWESEDAILVQATEGEHSWWLRCSTGSLRCERAADLGANGSVIVPTR